jgi:hypothetical protein
MKLDANKPLTRVVGLHLEGNDPLVFQVLYENLPKFCDVCELFGHGDTECGDGDHDDSAKQHGAWLVAPMEDGYPQTTGVRFRMPRGVRAEETVEADVKDGGTNLESALREANRYLRGRLRATEARGSPLN